MRCVSGHSDAMRSSSRIVLVSSINLLTVDITGNNVHYWELVCHVICFASFVLKIEMWVKPNNVTSIETCET